jgi:Domain of unknown function (DUF4136)
MPAGDRPGRRQIMYSPSRLVRFAVLALSAVALASCASMNVSSYVARGTDLGRYHTYAWGPAAATSTGDPRLDSNPFFEERVQADVEKQLAARGFEKTSSGAPELWLHYHASVTQRVDANSADQKYGYCNECQPYVYDAGTLVVDLVDARTNQLVWRGWAEDSLDGVIDNQRLLETRVDNAVARIMQRLPPRL